MRLREYSLAMAFFACNATGAYAQNTESVIKLPNEIEFKSPVGPTNLQSAVLFGDPSTPGVYVIRIKYAAGDCPGLQKLRDVGSQSLVRPTECSGLSARAGASL